MIHSSSVTISRLGGLNHVVLLRSGMPTKERIARGHHGRWEKRPAPERRRGPDILTALLPGHESRTHAAPDAPADWGSDSEDSGSSHNGPDPPPERNGGMRYFRAIDVADREEREARGLKCLKYSWRTETGPTPQVHRGDIEAAKIYLRKLEIAIDKGGWSSSEALGLYNARKVWSARAKGNDPRYAEVGNRKGGLTKEETAAVKQRQIVLNMKRLLERRSNGD